MDRTFRVALHESADKFHVPSHRLDIVEEPQPEDKLCVTFSSFDEGRYYFVAWLVLLVDAPVFDRRAEPIFAELMAGQRYITQSREDLESAIRIALELEDRPHRTPGPN